MNAAAKPRRQVVCIELGSNINPETYLPRAVEALHQQFTVLAVSDAWKTPPVGCPDCGNYYLNAAVLVESDLPFNQLKHTLRRIESQLGRVRTSDKYAPRTIDLDILIIGDELIEPDLWQYAHLAVPVSELMPQFTHPTSGKTLAEIAKQLSRGASILRRPDVSLKNLKPQGR